MNSAKDWLCVCAAFLLGMPIALPAQEGDRDSGSNSLRECMAGLENHWTSQTEQKCPRALADLGKDLGADPHVIATLLNNLAVIACARGKYADAEAFSRRAIAVLEEAHDRDDSDLANFLNNLAASYYNQGKFLDAEKPYRRALAIRERLLGPDHPLVAQSLNNLGALYATFTDERAEPLYRRALLIHERASGPESLPVAGTLNNLAVLYLQQRKHAQAEPLLRRELEALEKQIGPDHSRVATALHNLGLAYRSRRMYADAAQYTQRALATRRNVFGHQHPLVALTLNLLGEIRHAQGAYTEAEALYKEALTIEEKSLGLDHPSTAHTMMNYALLLRQTKRKPQARALEAQARMILSMKARENPANWTVDLSDFGGPRKRFHLEGHNNTTQRQNKPKHQRSGAPPTRTEFGHEKHAATPKRARRRGAGGLSASRTGPILDSFHQVRQDPQGPPALEGQRWTGRSTGSVQLSFWGCPPPCRRRNETVIPTISWENARPVCRLSGPAKRNRGAGVLWQIWRRPSDLIIGPSPGYSTIWRSSLRLAGCTRTQRSFRAARSRYSRTRTTGTTRH